jgi:hypothetical protein
MAMQRPSHEEKFPTRLEDTIALEWRGGASGD